VRPMRDRSTRTGFLAAAALGVGLVAAVAAGAAPGNHGGHGWHPRAYRPPPGRYFHGVSGTVGKERDFQRFRHRVRAHPAVIEDFFPWNTPLTTGALSLWHRTSTRGMLSLSTRSGAGEVITPREIAAGRGDHYIVRLNQSIAASGQVVYIRLMPEMNGHWNPYCAYDADGSPRGHGHATKWFRRAWRRFAIIVRGGRVAGVNRRLERIGMPPLLRARADDAPIYRKRGVGRRLARPKVAMVWNPQTIASPPVDGNRPAAYWPGRRYVDWVGADIYSKFATPGVRAALTGFYRRYDGYPFEIGEYSPWDADPGGRFTKWLFRWSNRHSRARMLVYYRSVYGGSAYDINHYDDARRALRRILDQPRWISYPAGTRHRRGG
jgi:hypothetical protein